MVKQINFLLLFLTLAFGSKASYVSSDMRQFPKSPKVVLNHSDSLAELATVAFAKSQVSKALRRKGKSIEVTYQLDSSLGEQSFLIQSETGAVRITGGCEKGLMYGGLEIAEMIELEYDLQNIDLRKAPDHLNRGIKFNIPLDARSPSYDDTGDAAQKNIENMWDIEFWKAFFDRMAIHRYNVLSLWTPNPFQVMTQLPSYPELALDDVCVTSAKPMGMVGEWSDAGGVNDTVLKNLSVVKEMTIQDKVSFWQEVFDYASDRGVDLYLFTWNIYTNGTFGKYGLTDEIDNPETKAYYREAIRVFLETYPQIKGIGVTAGERMHVEEGKDVADERERWLWETYGKGILDYKEVNPEREIHFVHRVWYSKFDQIMKYWDDYPDPFDVGYKYIKARIYSSPKESPFIGALKSSLQSEGLKCWWNLRNDDIFVFRWGDPDYVRTFLGNLPENITAGYHMGADGYVFGRVFSDRSPAISGTMELDKHWYKFMLWGRLGYDNGMTNDHFEKMLANHYQTTDEQVLLETWQAASKIVPQINRFVFHTGDRHWSPEMCSSRESFKYAPYFRNGPVMAGEPIQTPKAFIASKSSDQDISKSISPASIVDSLHYWSDQVLSSVKKINLGSADSESVKADLEAVAWLGKYYAQKINASILLELAAAGSNSNQGELLSSISAATSYWDKYADISDSLYYPQMFSRVNMMDWQELKKDVAFDEYLVENMETEFSLENQLALMDADLRIAYPYKNTKKWIEIQGQESGQLAIFLYDERRELMDVYRHTIENGSNVLVWEDLTWLKKGKYQMVLNVNGKTATCSFER